MVRRARLIAVALVLRSVATRRSPGTLARRPSQALKTTWVIIREPVQVGLGRTRAGPSQEALAPR